MRQWNRQAFKRPKRKRLGIPLQNPRRPDWSRWGESFEGGLDGSKPSLTTGPDFNVGPGSTQTLTTQPPPPRFVVLSKEAYLELRLYRDGVVLWLIEINYATSSQFRSKLYADRESAIQAYFTDTIVWIRREPYSVGED